MQEMQVRSLGQEDLLEEGMAIPSSVLALRIPWTTVHMVATSQTRQKQLNTQVCMLSGLPYLFNTAQNPIITNSFICYLSSLPISEVFHTSDVLKPNS